MDRLLERLYRRLGKRYFLLYIVFEAASAVLITVGTVGFMTLYQDISPAQFWRLTAIVTVVIGVIFVWGVLNVRAFARPLVGWVCGERGDPVTAWRRAVALP